MLLSLATSSDVLKVSIQNGYMEYSTIAVAVLAFIISVIVAVLQLKVYYYEWRPVLVYDRTQTMLKVYEKDDILEINYNLFFVNSGKTPIQFEMKYLEVLIDGIKQELVNDVSKGHLIAPGNKGSFHRYYCFGLDEEMKWVANRTIPETRIRFQVEYYNAVGKQKKYQLDYDIDITYEPNGDGYRELFIKSNTQ